MNDEASRRQEKYRGLRRREELTAQSGTAERSSELAGQTGGSPRDGASPNGSWGAGQPPAEPGSTSGPGGAEPGAGADTLEQQYANAVSAMNHMVNSLDFSELTSVINVFRATVEVIDQSDPARSSVLNNLGSATQLAHLRSGEVGDLEDAVEYYGAAAAAARSTDKDVVLYLSNLALAQTDLATKAGQSRHAEEAVLSARQAVEQTPRRDHRRALVLVRLSNALKTHARLAESTASDDEMIDVLREAARVAAPADRVDLLVNLGSALLRRYERAGAIEDLDGGIDQLRPGIDGLADGEPRRLAICQLCDALLLRFRRVGDLNDLHSVINELVGVLDILDPGHPLTGRVVRILSRALAEHTDSTGEPDSLRRALRSLDHAVRTVSATDPMRASALAGFAALLRRNFLYGGQGNVMEAAVAANEAAIPAAQRDDERSTALISLGTTLLTRYDHRGDTADLDRATDVVTEAVELAGADTPQQYTGWAQLGLLAAHRYRLRSQQEDLDSSVDLFERALNAMPPTAPDRAAVANQLGRSLRILHQRHGRRRSYRWARKILTEAAEQPTAPTDQRLRAAALSGRLAAQAGRWAEALESFTLAVELLPLVTRGKRVVATPKAQQRWARITADAVAAALECGEPERAVELLEHGRCAILADFLPGGGELGELHREQPAMADRAVRLRRLLDRPPEEACLAGAFDETEERVRRADAWDGLLREIRTLPGQQNHLRITPFSQLAASGEHGAAVLVNLSKYRSDALVVFGGRVLPITLPDAAPEAAAGQTEAALAAAREGDDADLLQALHWMWERITRPVLDRMGYLYQPEEGTRWPRVWWSVTGPLAFIPLHAATSRTGECVLDRVVSSYTPTLHTLLGALRHPVPDQGTPLVAAGSSEKIARELPPSNRILAQYWPTAEVISTEASSADDVLRSLPQHPWVHICEHSVQFPAQPAAGILLNREPPDRALGLVELGPVVLDQAEFCYLGDIETAPEPPTAAALPLAGALGFAGFTHVIGTLWTPDTDSGTTVHAYVYERLFGSASAEDPPAISEFDSDGSAFALHAAMRELRAAFPDRPTRWAAHLHVGP